MHLRTAFLVGRSVSSVRGSPRRLLAMDPAPRAILGCVQTVEDVTMDTMGPALMSRIPDVRLCLTKLPTQERLQSAAPAVFPKGSCDVLAYAGAGEGATTLKEAHPNAKVTDVNTALVEALQHVNTRRIALVTAYGEEAHEQMKADLTAAGFLVVAGEYLGLVSEAAASRVNLDSLQQTLVEYRDTEADTVVVGGGLPVCTPGYLDIVEDAVAKTVITGQQALLWHMLRLAGVHDTMGGFGGLLRGRTRSVPPPSPAPTGDPLQDCYPTRVAKGTAGLIPRVDPVVDWEQKYPGPLSTADLDNYYRDGVLCIRKVFSPAEVEKMKAATEDIKRYYESCTFDQLHAEGGDTLVTEQAPAEGVSPILKSISQVHLPEPHAPQCREHGPLFRRMVTDSRVIDRVRQIVGTEVYAHQSRVNFQSKSGGGFGWQQDFEQWHSLDGMPRMRAVSVAILLDAATHYNGALMVLPGSHHTLLQAYKAEGLKEGAQVPQDIFLQLCEKHGIRYCTGKPGDIILFDSNTFTGTHSNISPWSRCMVVGVYNSVENVCAPAPYWKDQGTVRPEHMGSHDPRYAGVPLSSLNQDLSV